jgi:hypothetical protein
MMMLIFPLLISHLNGIYKDCIIVSILFCGSGFWYNGASVANLYTGQDKEYEFFTKRIDVPVLVLSKCVWKCSWILPHLADEQHYEFPLTKGSLQAKLAKYDYAVLVFSEDYSDGEVLNFVPKDFRLTKLNKVGNCFTVYECERGGG